MAIEICKVCGVRVRTMAYLRTGACSQRCLESLEAHADSLSWLGIRVRLDESMPVDSFRLEALDAEGWLNHG